MKKISFILLITQFIVGSNLFAQKALYSPDITPKTIENSEALKRTKAALSVCGFVSAYFQKSDLLDLMDVKNCVGIRFYIAMQDPMQRYSDVIAVAVNENGKEIGNFLERKYHLAKSLDAHYPDEYSKMNRSTAKRYVSNLNEFSKLEPFAVFMGMENLNQLLSAAECSGIRIYSGTMDGTVGSTRTMLYGSTKVEGRLVKDVGLSYSISHLPCPVDCGDDPYLWQ